MDGDGEGEGGVRARKRESRKSCLHNFYVTHMNEFFNSTAREYSPLSKGLT